MKRSRFSEEQIIAILKEHEAGMPTADVCRRHEINNLHQTLARGYIASCLGIRK